MRRLTRGRAATDDEIAPPASGASDPVGDAASHARPEGGSPEAATLVTEPAAPGHETSETAAERPAGGTTETGGAASTETTETGGGASAERDVPAGLDAGELAAASAGSARRGRLRRRLHYLRHARELLLRDLGGFYYEAHRSEGGADAHRRLLDVKARRLATLDAEVRELEKRLSEPHPQAVLREPGIGGTCRECGELHGSDARFCPRCGTPLTRRAARRHAAAVAEPAPHEELGRPTTASLWGRRRTPEPPPPPQATQAAGDEAPAIGDEPRTVDETTGGATSGDAPAAAGDESSRPAADGDGSSSAGEEAPVGAPHDREERGS